jgi:hypothetical protein
MQSGLQMIPQYTGHGSNTSCTPPGVTSSQEADVVLDYLNRNPDKRDLAGVALVEPQ